MTWIGGERPRWRDIMLPKRAAGWGMPIDHADGAKCAALDIADDVRDAQRGLLVDPFTDWRDVGGEGGAE